MEPLLPFETRMELAIAEMSLEEKDSCRSIAMKYSLNHTTLSRRFKGEQVSRTVANSEYRQRLSSKQEETFLKYINKLSDRGLPPTSQIAKKYCRRNSRRGGREELGWRLCQAAQGSGKKPLPS